MPDGRRPRVALLVESSRGYGRGLLMGIAEYASTHGDWSCYHQEHILGKPLPNWLNDWEGDGIIARVDSKAAAEQLQALQIPLVDLRGSHPMEGVPVVETDDETVVRLAGEELLNRGLKNIAFCGFSSVDYSDRRKDYFIKYLETHGIEPFVRLSPATQDLDTPSKEGSGILHEVALQNWLVDLPKPVGVFACNDIRGQQVINACNHAGLAVPEEVAIIGVDNDEIICQLTNPGLSSVDVDSVRIGFEASDLLARMMAGQSPPTTTTLVQPLSVVTRKSTSVMAIDDPLVVKALEYIQAHACEGITVSDVVKQIPLSRSTLDRRFSELLGRSPKSEINRIRLLEVRRLLVESDYKLSLIAKLTGFAHAEYMSSMFKEQIGETPGEFRQLRRRLYADDRPSWHRPEED